MRKILFLLIILAASNYSQDSHYWNIQYGTKATLLGGAVIGSVSDLSATFYNPGAVSLFDDPKLILSAKVYQLDQITVINGAGENKDLNYSSITPAPTFVAFNVNIDSAARNKLAFSVLTRQSMNFEFEKREIETDAGLNSSIEGGGLSLHQKLDEIWSGVTFSHKLSSTVGLGVTTYVAYRNQTTNYQTIIEGLDSVNRISSFLAYRNLYFNNYRILFKAGMGVVLSPVTLGFTLTTPSINLFGSGSYGYHNFINNPDDPGQNVYQSNYQDDLKSKYKTSWAIGFGTAYWGEKFSVHFSAEWYDAIKKYNPISLAPLYSQSSGETFTEEILQQLSGIVNAGLGIDYKLNDEVSFAGGFITDFSANDINTKGNISLSRWDIYHLSGGSSFKIGTSEVTLGFAYSFGSDVIRQIADIGNPDAGAAENVNSQADVKFTKIKFMFGFIF
ncbi:MAG TPA: hypothetical protein VLM39_10715 [Ignavibacteriaceae bacterium]|nr:hypothetical protein [Ignavibacteriaceae bacterium]